MTELVKTCTFKRSDGVCGKPVKEGYEMCGGHVGYLKRHGNATHAQSVIDKGVENNSRKLLREIMAENGITITVPEFNEDFNPYVALLETAQEQLAWKDLCLAKIAQLKEDEWRWDGDRAGEQLRSEIQLYERAIQRASDLLIKIGRLGIEERLTRIAERQSALIETAIVRTIQDLDLPLEIQAKARSRVIAHLKAL